ncbi:uncharacterized protein LOC124115963 [Haliotis rufescens]|uniref:uncharacterized protein LOC124115963 n=1 Tax=Haliotis rufescens TaxID=6454 RepID=UPI00201F63C9|nr:uncharacterized protein LOC124115963 [Haliotis rufescens]
MAEYATEASDKIQQTVPQSFPPTAGELDKHRKYLILACLVVYLEVTMVKQVLQTNIPTRSTHCQGLVLDLLILHRLPTPPDRPQKDLVEGISQTRRLHQGTYSSMNRIPVVVAAAMLAMLALANGRRTVRKSVYKQWCEDLEDGMYISDCTTFYRCVNETTEYLPCPSNLVANEKHMWCDYKDLVKPPCGTAPNCTGMDGNYPDYARKCQYYFTCLHDDFYGYTRCAANLLFNPEKNNCDWPWLVKPPCGTAQGNVWPDGRPQPHGK